MALTVWKNEVVKLQNQRQSCWELFVEVGLSHGIPVGKPHKYSISVLKYLQLN